MNYEEFKEKMKDIEKEYNLKKYHLEKEYAFSNNSVQIGDKISDHIGSIIVNKIKFLRMDIPSCVYYGIVLNKNGSIGKRQKERYVYQNNMTKEQSNGNSEKQS